MLNNTGLTNKEVNISRNKYGSNSINGKNKSTFISLFIETLGDPIIKILLIEGLHEKNIEKKYKKNREKQEIQSMYAFPYFNCISIRIT